MYQITNEYRQQLRFQTLQRIGDKNQFNYKVTLYSKGKLKDIAPYS